MTTLEALERLNKHDIILASKSPRRQQLLKGVGVRFRTLNHHETDEIYPDKLIREEIPLFLAQNKALHYKSLLKDNSIIITADTIVWLNNEVIGKPVDKQDAVNMLMKLSGRMHEVFTGVCIKTRHKEILFHAETRVFFRKLSADEIRYYVTNYEPYDKAGSYGVQEWIGYVAVEHIEGSFYNVMGLPIKQLYCELIKITE